MKKFSCLSEALSYKTCCPFCKSKLNINALYSSNVLKFDDIECTIYVDIETEKVTIHTIENYLMCSFGRSISIACANCCDFYYILQIWMSPLLNKVTEISLNSEAIHYIDSVDNLYTIRNNYVYNKTKYSRNLVLSNRKDYEIPIIDINYDNIIETIDKIEKLIIFS